MQMKLSRVVTLITPVVLFCQLTDVPYDADCMHNILIIFDVECLNINGVLNVSSRHQKRLLECLLVSDILYVTIEPTLIGHTHMHVSTCALVFTLSEGFWGLHHRRTCNYNARFDRWFLKINTLTTTFSKHTTHSATCGQI